jgi:hypothetical protein
MCGIHDGHHRVEAREFPQTPTLLIRKGKGLGNRQGLRYSGGLDEQIVKPPLGGEAGHFLEQVVTQRAANASIGHLDELFLGAGEFRSSIAHKISVNVHLAHVIHDDGDASAFAIIENVVEKRRLPGSKKTGKNRDWQFFCIVHF